MNIVTDFLPIPLNTTYLQFITLYKEPYRPTVNQFKHFENTRFYSCSLSWFACFLNTRIVKEWIKKQTRKCKIMHALNCINKITHEIIKADVKG